ncbi:MAG: dCTP deaminase [Anaerolineae bacterium]|nr:dCTP deaminase [Anaerolineae bacterium]
MSIKADRWIRHMVNEMDMITPFEPDQIAAGVVSYGLSSYGYDARLADEFKVPAAQPGVLDPKGGSGSTFTEIESPVFDLAPGHFVLGRTIEYFRLPPDVLALCLGKSSYARCGVLVNATPFEPGWEGYATLSIANLGTRPVRLYAHEGIAQVLFFQSDEPCEVSYADRRGKYQSQRGITPARPG